MEEAAPHTIAPPALALELLARTERYFWLGPTGRWHAVITHFCPLPGQEVAASDTIKEEGFIFQAVHQASQFNSFPASISLFFPSPRFWVPSRQWEGKVHFLWKPSSHVVIELYSASQIGRFPKWLSEVG